MATLLPNHFQLASHRERWYISQDDIYYIRAQYAASARFAFNFPRKGETSGKNNHSGVSVVLYYLTETGMLKRKKKGTRGKVHLPHGFQGILNELGTSFLFLKPILKQIKKYCLLPYAN